MMKSTKAARAMIEKADEPYFYADIEGLFTQFKKEVVVIDRLDAAAPRLEETDDELCKRIDEMEAHHNDMVGMGIEG
jgi:hypothetical protein